MSSIIERHSTRQASLMTPSEQCAHQCPAAVHPPRRGWNDWFNRHRLREINGDLPADD